MTLWYQWTVIVLIYRVLWVRVLITAVLGHCIYMTSMLCNRPIASNNCMTSIFTGQFGMPAHLCFVLATQSRRVYCRMGLAASRNWLSEIRQFEATSTLLLQYTFMAQQLWYNQLGKYTTCILYAYSNMHENTATSNMQPSCTPINI